MTKQHKYDGWSYERLRQQRNRAHFLLEDPYRFITVLLHNGALYAIDSPCYHASGPLGEGELLDVEDAHTAASVACLRCPWHHILVSIATGEEMDVQAVPPPTHHGGSSGGGVGGGAMEMPTYPLRPHWEACGGAAKASRGRVVQRTHKVWLDEAKGILTIEVEDDAAMRRHPVPSDAAAGDLK
ncbi:hypothetical protein DQ04_21941010, partial [Trypanosoma grayi]|uniref:hypothetical protein n=1 Tax=Trypanosoma grayi TaxID=71804 RepID=UPI0004F48239